MIRLNKTTKKFNMFIELMKKEEDKMSEMLAKFADEDRTLSFNYNIETKQKSKKAKPPYITSTLQQDAVNKLNFARKFSRKTYSRRVCYQKKISKNIMLKIKSP